MSVLRLDHIGIAVENLETSSRLYREVLGIEGEGWEEVPDQQVRVAFFPVEGSEIELLEPTHESSPVARFLARRGPGIHHLALRVDDLPVALERARQAGLRLLDENPRPGAGGARIAFLHPQDTDGVLLELCERGQ